MLRLRPYQPALLIGQSSLVLDHSLTTVDRVQLPPDRRLVAGVESGVKPSPEMGGVFHFPSANAVIPFI